MHGSQEPMIDAVVVSFADVHVHVAVHSSQILDQLLT